jgi:elongation factor G
MFPVVCVSAIKDMGVRRLMEFIGNVAPSVNMTQKPVTTDGTEVTPDANGPASLYVFKTSIDRISVKFLTSR